MIGSGSFGDVWFACHNHTNEFCALKIMPFKNSDEREHALREAKILQSLDHKHIVKLHRVFEDQEPESSRTYVVMQMECFPRNLKQFIQNKQDKISEELVISLLLQLADAMAYLHSQDKIHRDIKPENVLILGDEPNMQIKIADFGLSRDVINNEAQTFCGTPPYMPRLVALLWI